MFLYLFDPWLTDKPLKFNWLFHFKMIQFRHKPYICWKPGKWMHSLQEWSEYCLLCCHQTDRQAVWDNINHINRWMNTMMHFVFSGLKCTASLRAPYDDHIQLLDFKRAREVLIQGLTKRPKPEHHSWNVCCRPWKMSDILNHAF